MEEKDLVNCYRKTSKQVARTYSKKDEEGYYFFVCKKLVEKYPSLVSFEELMQKVSTNGNIVTMDMRGQDGFYDYENNVIGINHYLNRMTTVLFHEIVHKINYISANKVKKLPTVLDEAGTEMITSDTLKKSNRQTYIFGNYHAKIPNTQTSYFVSTPLIRQINFALGNYIVEDSILNGSDRLENELKSSLGDKDYKELVKAMNEAQNEFTFYSSHVSMYKGNEEDKSIDKLSKMVDKSQNVILRIFDKRMDNIKTSKQAKTFLNDLIEFSDMRFKQKVRGKLVDDAYNAYFENAKKELSEKFPKANLDVKLEEPSWKYGIFKKINEITPEEEKQIRDEAKAKKQFYFPGFLARLFKKKSDVKLIEEPIENKNIGKTSNELNMKLKVDKAITYTKTDSKVSMVKDNKIKE